jgi:hypothetical protein
MTRVGPGWAVGLERVRTAPGWAVGTGEAWMGEGRKVGRARVGTVGRGLRRVVGRGTAGKGA